MYRIEEIELVDFTGMWLNNITYFKLTLKEIITLVLGRNGCGKSRLMAQLSPLAPEKSDFTDGGSKKVTFAFNNERFESLCKKQKGSLKCYITNLTTGEEITKGSNPTVHNTTIKNLFDYDYDLHQLLTGRVLLTDMKAPERKKWFSKLSTSDLGYALEFYKRSRENVRDISGAIKSLKFSIGELRPKVLTDQDIYESVKARIEVLQSDISIIESECSALNYDDTVTTETVIAYNKKLDELYVKLIKLDVSLPDELADTTREQLVSGIERCTTALNIYSEEQTKMLEVLNRNSQLESIDIGALEAQIKEYESDIVEAKEELKLFKTLTDFNVTALRNAESLAIKHTPDLIRLMNYCDTEMYRITDSESKRLPLNKTQEYIDNLDNLILENQKAINKLDNDATKFTEHLKIIEQTLEVECDSCHHRFKPGVKASDKTNMQNALGVIAVRKEEANKLAEKYYENKTKATELLNEYRELVNIVNVLSSNEVTKVLVELILSENGFTDNHNLHIGKIQRFVVEIGHAITAGIDIERVNKLNHDLAIAKASQNNDVSQLKANYEESLKRTEAVAYERSILNNKFKLLLDFEKRMETMQSMVADVDAMESVSSKLDSTLVSNIKYATLQEHKKELWELLTVAKQRFDTMERERIRLEDMELQLSNNELRYNAAKRIMEAMSPEGGLLAKYLYNSITRITELMTDYVKRMWGYEMRILPCDISDGDLDYQFPFWVMDKSKMQSDVSKGSTAQKEVINFVFTLAVYKAKKLNQWPLLLDELSSGFDEGHRSNMIDFLKHAVATQQCSQIVMVSHNANTHNQLIHADVCVINPEGIVLPVKYNTNVEIG